MTHDDDDPPPQQTWSDQVWWFLNRYAEECMRYARLCGFL
jgi:hypothetical protein